MNTAKTDEKPFRMSFVFRGFQQTNGQRTYTYDGVAADRSRSEFTVLVELAMLRRHKISLQELPLLCRAVLDSEAALPCEQRSYAFGEVQMCVQDAYAAAKAEAAQKRRKAPKRAPAHNPEHAWSQPMR